MIDSHMNPRPHAAASPRPLTALRRWMLLACLCLSGVVLAPSTARAQEEEIKQDARLEGYQGNVSVANQSTALMWLLFVLLAVIALAVLFKDAKRTHLD
jgi:hypothetical protein